MSPKNNREDWRWLSLFDPKTGNGIPPIEGGFEVDYQVDEEYSEAEEDDINDEDDNDDFDNYTEENSPPPVFADGDEDEE